MSVADSELRLPEDWNEAELAIRAAYPDADVIRFLEDCSQSGRVSRSQFLKLVLSAVEDVESGQRGPEAILSLSRLGRIPYDIFRSAPRVWDACALYVSIHREHEGLRNGVLHEDLLFSFLRKVVLSHFDEQGVAGVLRIAEERGMFDSCERERRVGQNVLLQLLRCRAVDRDDASQLRVAFGHMAALAKRLDEMLFMRQRES
jgi:hypothetical protein